MGQFTVQHRIFVSLPLRLNLKAKAASILIQRPDSSNARRGQITGGIKILGLDKNG
jgi:hypothetical protein